VFNALVEAATAGSPLHYVDLSGEFACYSTGWYVWTTMCATTSTFVELLYLLLTIRGC
jgi:hypothetical protein